MNKKTEKEITEKILSSIKFETLLNRDNDELPYGYYNPRSEGKVYWMCNYDKNNNITSVFAYKNEDEKDRRINYLENEEHAKEIRDILIKDGWKKIKSPKIEFDYPKH